MSEYTEAQAVLFDIYENVLDFKDTITSKAFENADKALEIANRVENVDIDKAVKKFCAEKKMGECDAICSFCFGGEIFKEGYNTALADIRGDKK